jgi:hypothetical protein
MVSSCYHYCKLEFHAETLNCPHSRLERGQTRVHIADGMRERNAPLESAGRVSFAKPLRRDQAGRRPLPDRQPDFVHLLAVDGRVGGLGIRLTSATDGTGDW